MNPSMYPLMQAILEAHGAPKPEPEGIFRDHSCWKCNDGTKPCVQGHPRRCEYPHARND